MGNALDGCCGSSGHVQEFGTGKEGRRLGGVEETGGGVGARGHGRGATIPPEPRSMEGDSEVVRTESSEQRRQKMLEAASRRATETATRGKTVSAAGR